MDVEIVAMPDGWHYIIAWGTTAVSLGGPFVSYASAERAAARVVAWMHYGVPTDDPTVLTGSARGE